MSFGSQTVTFVDETDTGAAGKLGTKQQAPTSVAVAGCRHRPLSSSETPEDLTDVSTQVWKTTAPPVAASMNAGPRDHLIVDGVTYQIVGGAEVFEDFEGPFKVTVLSRIKVG